VCTQGERREKSWGVYLSECSSLDRPPPAPHIFSSFVPLRAVAFLRPKPISPFFLSSVIVPYKSCSPSSARGARAQRRKHHPFLPPTFFDRLQSHFLLECGRQSSPFASRGGGLRPAFIGLSASPTALPGAPSKAFVCGTCLAFQLIPRALGGRLPSFVHSYTARACGWEGGFDAFLPRGSMSMPRRAGRTRIPARI